MVLTTRQDASFGFCSNRQRAWELSRYHYKEKKTKLNEVKINYFSCAQQKNKVCRAHLEFSKKGEHGER